MYAQFASRPPPVHLATDQPHAQRTCHVCDCVRPEQFRPLHTRWAERRAESSCMYVSLRAAPADPSVCSGRSRYSRHHPHPLIPSARAGSHYAPISATATAPAPAPTSAPSVPVRARLQAFTRLIRATPMVQLRAALPPAGPRGGASAEEVTVDRGPQSSGPTVAGGAQSKGGRSRAGPQSKGGAQSSGAA
eukprot:3339353-Prymnesium_polylepis.1